MSHKHRQSKNTSRGSFYHFIKDNLPIADKATILDALFLSYRQRQFVECRQQQILIKFMGKNIFISADKVKTPVAVSFYHTDKERMTSDQSKNTIRGSFYLIIKVNMLNANKF